MCLLIEYMEYCVWVRSHGWKPESYADFLQAHFESAVRPEGFWRDDDADDV